MSEFRTKTGARRLLVFAVALTAALPVAAQAGPPPADKCEASKNKIAGAFYACVEKAESTSILKGLPADYSKCVTKFLDKWGTAETNSVDTCPDTITVSQDMADYLAAQAAEAASVIGGADIPTCAADLGACQADLAALSTGCDAPFECPASDASHQTICGQIFDLEDGSKYQEMGATGTQCTTPTATGPCSLNIRAYDALDFAANPMSAMPLVSPVYIDDCGRYRVIDVALATFGFIGLVVDDAAAPQQGPTGSTNPVGVTKPNQAGMAAPNFDAWIASKTTTDLWETTGSPPVSGGLYVPIFFEAVATTSRDLQDGVTFARNGSLVPLLDHYFVATESARHTIDPAATATGVNGTALVDLTGGGPISVSGSGGGLPPSCVWPTYLGASPAGVLSVQAFRPEDAPSQTCDR